MLRMGTRLGSYEILALTTLRQAKDEVLVGWSANEK
jgi:hypothetical protein